MTFDHILVELVHRQLRAGELDAIVVFSDVNDAFDGVVVKVLWK